MLRLKQINKEKEERAQQIREIKDELNDDQRNKLNFSMQSTSHKMLGLNDRKLA